MRLSVAPLAALLDEADLLAVLAAYSSIASPPSLPFFVAYFSTTCV